MLILVPPSTLTNPQLAFLLLIYVPAIAMLRSPALQRCPPAGGRASVLAPPLAQGAPVSATVPIPGRARPNTPAQPTTVTVVIRSSIVRGVAPLVHGGSFETTGYVFPGYMARQINAHNVYISMRRGQQSMHVKLGMLFGPFNTVINRGVFMRILSTSPYAHVITIIVQFPPFVILCKMIFLYIRDAAPFCRVYRQNA